MRHHQNPPNPAPKGGPESAPRPVLTTPAPSPFQRTRPLAAPPFARIRASPSEQQDDTAPKKRKLSTAARFVDQDPATGNASGDVAHTRLGDPAGRSVTVERPSVPPRNRNLDNRDPYFEQRDDTDDHYLLDNTVYVSNMISIRVQDMLSRLQGSLYGPGDIDSPTEEQNERMDIILDLLTSINEAASNILVLKRVLLQKMRTLSHDRPFQNALFQVYKVCLGHQNQTLRLAAPLSKPSSSGLPSSKSL